MFRFFFNEVEGDSVDFAHITGIVEDESEGEGIIFGERNEFILTHDEELFEFFLFGLDKLGDGVPSISGVHPEAGLVGREARLRIFGPLAIDGKEVDSRIVIVAKDYVGEFRAHRG